jgi:hypothetical protein
MPSFIRRAAVPRKLRTLRLPFAPFDLILNSTPQCAEKRENNLHDFSTRAHDAENHGRTRRTVTMRLPNAEIAKLRRILVDEYQDTNEVQDIYSGLIQK